MLPTILDQDEVWVDGAGQSHRLEEMDRHHRANLIPFLRRSAVTLYIDALRRGVTFAGHDDREGQSIAESWLEQTPLMRRLVELEQGRPIEERRATFDRNQAFEAETGYVKARLVAVPAEHIDRDNGADW